MPRLRRSARLQHQDVDSPRTRERLFSGCDFAPFFDGPDLTEAELRDAWRDLCEELLAQHIRDHPGTRPWAWWEWDSKEPRRQIEDNPGPVLESRHPSVPPGTRYGDPVAGCKLWFGKPSEYHGMLGWDLYESEADYLGRLKLLTREERRILAR